MVFKLRGVDRQSDPPREGRVDIDRLARDAQPAFLPGHELDGPHVVKTIRELDDQDPDVSRSRQDELLKVLGLLLTRPVPGEFGKLGHAVNEICDRIAEQTADVVNRRVGILDRVVKEPGDDRRLIHLQFGQQAGDGDRVSVIRIAGMTKLLTMTKRGEHIGLVERFLIRIRLIGEDPFDKLILTQISAGTGSRGLGLARGLRRHASRRLSRRGDLSRDNDGGR